MLSVNCGINLSVQQDLQALYQVNSASDLMSYSPYFAGFDNLLVEESSSFQGD